MTIVVFVVELLRVTFDGMLGVVVVAVAVAVVVVVVAEGVEAAGVVWFAVLSVVAAVLGAND